MLIKFADLKQIIFELKALNFLELGIMCSLVPDGALVYCSSVVY